jgi:hypothetical protein
LGKEHSYQPKPCSHRHRPPRKEKRKEKIPKNKTRTRKKEILTNHLRNDHATSRSDVANTAPKSHTNPHQNLNPNNKAARAGGKVAVDLDFAVGVEDAAVGHELAVVGLPD